MGATNLSKRKIEFEQFLSQPEAGVTKGLRSLSNSETPLAFWVLSHTEGNSCMWGDLLVLIPLAKVP